MLLGKSCKLDAVLGEKRLVGRHDGLAGGKRGLDRELRRIVLAAHQFDENVNSFVGREGYRVADPAQLGLPEVALLVGSARGGCNDLDAAPAPGLDDIALLRDEAHDGRADRTKSGKTRF